MKKNVLLFIVLFINISPSFAAGFPSSYYEIRDIKKQKEVFLNHLYKLIKKENEKILEDRKLIKNILLNNIFNINNVSNNFSKLLKLHQKYKIKSIYSKEEFLKKVDIIPPSLALAQAAVESGWGKSRFVKEANNIYGHWTFGEKGIIPEKREKNKKHKIRIFSSLQNSVSAYMLNLNTHRAYHLFRTTRFQLRKQNQNPTGSKLSSTMKNYSEIGDQYLKLLTNLINKQKLSKFDNEFFNKVNHKI